MIHIIYMAAGNSRRFGKNKLMEEWRGKPLYEHGLDRILSVMEERKEEITLTVVTQYRALASGILDKRELETDSLKERIRVIINPESEWGVSYTIRAGITEVLKTYGEGDSAFMFMVADQPFLKTETIKRLLDRIRQEKASGTFETISLKYEDRPGNPCIFHSSLVPELLKLTGDQGGRKVLKKHKCIFVEAEDPFELYDIDTAADMEAVIKDPAPV